MLGDFNDGPGLDEYEKLFGRSGVEIVLGEDGQEELFDPHARMALGRRVGAMPATARFYILRKSATSQALLDYVMVSPDLRAMRPALADLAPVRRSRSATTRRSCARRC